MFLDPVTGAVLDIVARWVHILSVVILLGGIVFARWMVTPAPPSNLNPRSRRLLAPLVLMIVFSGTYSLIAKSNIPPSYFFWFGIKLLLVLHFAAVSFLLARSSTKEERRNRLFAGAAISGSLVVLLSAYLRFLSNWKQP